MDLYLPNDFIPHADYSWSEPRGTSHDSVPAGEDWFGAEAYVSPALCDDLRTAAEWRAL